MDPTRPLRTMRHSSGMAGHPQMLPRPRPVLPRTLWEGDGPTARHVHDTHGHRVQIVRGFLAGCAGVGPYRLGGTVTRNRASAKNLCGCGCGVPVKATYAK